MDFLTLEMLNVKFLRYLSLTSHVQKNNYMYVCMYVCMYVIDVLWRS